MLDRSVTHTICESCELRMNRTVPSQDIVQRLQALASAA